MARPRKDETRKHQINIRFSTHELVRVHEYAALTGKTVPEFGRTVLLRRPRRRRNGVEPVIIALPDAILEKWTTLGTRLNAVAHIMNARDDLPPQQLLPVLTQLRS